MTDIAKITCCTCNRTMKIISYNKWKCEECGFTTQTECYTKAKKLYNSTKTLLSFLVKSNVNLKSSEELK